MLGHVYAHSICIYSLGMLNIFLPSYFSICVAKLLFLSTFMGVQYGGVSPIHETSLGMLIFFLFNTYIACVIQIVRFDD